MKQPIYFDNAATTALCEEALTEMLPYLQQHYGNPSSIHRFGRVTRAAIERARKTVATVLNCAPSEIFFTGSGTESNNTVLKCAVDYLGVKRIITSAAEHPCVVNCALFLQEKGTEVDWVKLDAFGRPVLTHLQELLQKNTKPTLVSLMHSNNEIGTLTDIASVGELCAEHGALFHTDTVQTIGYYPIDLQQTKAHFLSGSAHKFHGPKGIGFLFIRSGTLSAPFLHGGSQERNMRAGTENVAGIVGMAKALELAVNNMDANRKHIYDIKKYAIQRLTETIPGISFNGDISEQGGHYKVLNVLFPVHPKAELLLFNLDMAGIAASGGSACSSGSEKVSHVLQAIGADPTRKAVRFSFCKYNTLSEIDVLIAELQHLLAPAPDVSAIHPNA
ncbi:MAG: cysteine desulfurase [Chitinophagales bacterium]|nr:cysteine desulfurase [Chitinophagales bacterium]MDW8418145.1 cysteine desulfurase family protein [Chitinophagales bacterium]